MYLFIEMEFQNPPPSPEQMQASMQKWIALG